MNTAPPMIRPAAIVAGGRDHGQEHAEPEPAGAGGLLRRGAAKQRAGLAEQVGQVEGQHREHGAELDEDLEGAANIVLEADQVADDQQMAGG
jgi:hypothetical protein